MPTDEDDNPVIIIRDTAEGVEANADTFKAHEWQYSEQLMRNYATLLRALPRTADGAVVVPGMVVYREDGEYAVAPGCIGSMAPVTTNRGGVLPCLLMYSTPELAEQARGEEGAGTDE